MLRSIRHTRVRLLGVNKALRERFGALRLAGFSRLLMHCWSSPVSVDNRFFVSPKRLSDASRLFAWTKPDGLLAMTLQK